MIQQAHHFSWHVWYFPPPFHSEADRRPCSPEVHIPPRWTAAVYMMSRRSRPSGRCCLGPDAPSRWSWCSGHSEYIWCRISWGTQQTNCEPSDQLLLIKAESGLKLLQRANSQVQLKDVPLVPTKIITQSTTCFINTVHHFMNVLYYSYYSH